MTVFGELDEAIKEFFVIHDIAQVPPQAKETCRFFFFISSFFFSLSDSIFLNPKNSLNFKPLFPSFLKSHFLQK